MFVTDFPIDSDKSNVSKIVLRSRYPENGHAINTESEMIVYILNGSTELTQETTTVLHAQNDVVLVKSNTPYFWQPKGEVTLLIVSTPPWTPEQQKIV
jgi:mannose-6-phosphate isomerase-like protein (cupin superfamily)